MLNLNNKKIIITGSTSGIGKSCAIIASRLGAELILLGRDQNKLNTVLNLLEGTHHKSYIFEASNSLAYEQLISQIVNENGKINGFVNCAGIDMTKPLKVLEKDNIEEVLNINVVSGLLLAKEILKKKNIHDEASLIFISSIVGLYGQAGKIAYSSSKGAITAAVKSMALEYASQGIRVNAILPAIVKTEMSLKVLDMLGDEYANNIEKMHPLGFGSPDDVANACMFFLSDLSKWITGTSFIIDGGYSAK